MYLGKKSLNAKLPKLREMSKNKLKKLPKAKEKLNLEKLK